jgi:hypothetical protein
MLVSHETPISMLNESISYNCYQYALVHLFETHPKYYSFFKQSLLAGREVLLDNSIFELKEAFNAEKYAEYIKELKPTYYIVPDVLEEGYKTAESFISFTKEYSDLPGLKIGAIQGRSYDEIAWCYRALDLNGADYIAISFDFSFYQNIGKSLDTTDSHLAKLQRMCTGRQRLIKMLQEDGIWNFNKPHHLLGNSLPQEMKAYKNMPSIRSVDTSNPVIAGMHGIRYIKDYGMTSKPKALLADLIDAELTYEQQQDVLYNVAEYKKLCN